MNAIGMIETNSIPAGIEAGDAMLKAAAVELVTAQAVCAGKYIVLVAGDVSAVKSAVADGEPTAGNYLVDSIVIPNVHDQVIAALSACSDIKETAALGIIETYSLASAVICADAAVKAADIDLMEIRLGRGELAAASATLAIRYAVSAALALFFYGGNAMWVNVLSMVLFGIAIGVLICFLGGLMAVDIVPRKATGAALGVVGMTSYIAAGIQDVASGWLIDSNITVAADGVKHYDFGPVAIFWLAAAVISFLLPLLNRGKVKEF